MPFSEVSPSNLMTWQRSRVLSGDQALQPMSASCGRSGVSRGLKPDPSALMVAGRAGQQIVRRSWLPSGDQ
jgi:hypothetical protein